MYFIKKLYLCKLLVCYLLSICVLFSSLAITWVKNVKFSMEFKLKSEIIMYIKFNIYFIYIVY